jgi:hypothetical protein
MAAHESRRVIGAALIGNALLIKPQKSEPSDFRLAPAEDER